MDECSWGGSGERVDLRAVSSNSRHEGRPEGRVEHVSTGWFLWACLGALLAAGAGSLVWRCLPRWVSEWILSRLPVNLVEGKGVRRRSGDRRQIERRRF